jgi:hypothetical protein
MTTESNPELGAPVGAEEPVRIGLEELTAVRWPLGMITDDTFAVIPVHGGEQ